MAGHEWEDWFEREELIGQISDIRVQNLQVEREVVQKRTFTRWMNLHLEKCDPPMEVRDLFRDIQDGRLLMALLEELSGCKLLHGFKKSSHRIFRLNNIAKVLSFLEERNVKLVSIDAADVADGNSSIILGLIWNIILFFQIKELTGNIKSQFPSSSSLSSIPTSSDSDTSHSSGTPSEERRGSVAMRDHGRAIKKLLQWVQKRTRKFGVAVQDFSKSWTSGLAFLAVIKSIDSSLVDMRRALLRTAKENLEEAFRTAHYSLGIPRLLEPEDVTINPPDEQSIMTYVSQFLEHFPGIEEPEEPRQVIERSISMGRLSSRESDLDLEIRNSIQRSRLRERPYVRKDRVQPPPKIFISSISEDRGLRSPTSVLAKARSWASEDSSMGPAPGEDGPTGVGGESQDSVKEVFIISTSNSPQPSYVDSIISSESVIGDSAIGSPDSWVGSEAGTMPERFGESRSDGSLCDSGMAWDASMPCATPEEDPVLEQDLTSTSLDKPQDDQFIDEGIYSLSSLESPQERIHAQSEKEEEEADRYILNQDGESEHVPDEVKIKSQKDSEQMETSPLQRDQVSTEQQPSLGLTETPLQSDSGDAPSPEPKGTNQSQPSSHPMDRLEEGTDRESECAEEATELCEDSQLHEQQLNVETESVGARNGAGEFQEETICRRKDSLSEETGEESGILIEEVLERSKMQDETSQGVLNGHADPQDNTSTQISEENTSTQISEENTSTQISEDNTSTQISEDNTSTQISEDNTSTQISEDNTSTQISEDNTSTQISEENTATQISEDNTATQISEAPAMPCDPPERGEEIACVPETEGQAGDEDPGLTRASGSQEGLIDIPEDPNETSHDSGEPEDANSLESNLCISGDYLAETAPRIDSEQRKEMENGHLGGIDQCDIAGSSNADSPESEAIDETDLRTLDITDQPDGQFQDELCTKDDAQPNSSKPVDSWMNGEKGSTGYRPASEPTADMDLFYTDIDRSSPSEDLVSEPLDPMDLFYPDKEESMFTEPLEVMEIECTRSVFSMSALQPATPSEPLTEIYSVVQETSTGKLTETHVPQELGEDFGSTVHVSMQEQEKEMKNHHPPGAPSEEPQGRCRLPGDEDEEEEEEEEEETAGAWDATGIDPAEEESRGPAEHGDLSGPHGENPIAARDNTETVRPEAGSAKSTDESLLIASVLRHRNVSGSTESKDNQTKVSSSRAHSSNSDLGRRESEQLYLLLLLWLLLYCLWVLPQMDFSSLPDLLLNLDH